MYVYTCIYIGTAPDHSSMWVPPRLPWSAPVSLGPCLGILSSQGEYPREFMPCSRVRKLWTQLPLTFPCVAYVTNSHSSPAIHEGLLKINEWLKNEKIAETMPYWRSNYCIYKELLHEHQYGNVKILFEVFRYILQ